MFSGRTEPVRPRRISFSWRHDRTLRMPTTLLRKAGEPKLVSAGAILTNSLLPLIKHCSLSITTFVITGYFTFGVLARFGRSSSFNQAAISYDV